MQRPFSVIFLGSLLIAVGLGSSIYHLAKNPFDGSSIPVALVGAIAIVAGIFLIKGRNWARWLVLLWLAFHVIVSAVNSLSGSLAHLVLLLVVAYFLLTPPDSKFFASAPSK